MNTSLIKGILLGAALTLGAMLSGCTFSTTPVYPLLGDSVGLPTNMICDTYNADGSKNPDQDKFVAMRVTQGGDAGSKLYKYYIFNTTKAKEVGVGEPQVVSFHKARDGFYVIQDVDGSGYANYGWYDSTSHEFLYFETDPMGEAQVKAAEENHVVLDAQARQYYVAVNGTDANIRAYLEEVGGSYTGGRLKCLPA